MIGVGPGRGIGLGYVLLGLALLAVTAGGFAIRVLRRFDTEVEDSLPDDLVGANQRKTGNTSAAGNERTATVAPQRVR